MQITKNKLPIIAALRGFGLNHHIRGWNRIIRSIFPHDKQKFELIQTRMWNIEYLANPANYIDWSVLCYGSYEREELELFRRLGPRRGGVCLDIGANVGHHALYFASLGWTVHAFEPNPQLWSEFDAKVHASGVQSIALHRVGLGLEDGVLDFELENATNSGTGRFARSEFPPAGGSNIGRLPVYNGDRYLREQGIDVVDVVKMDIQGFEPEALSGLRDTLLRTRPLIAVEIAADNAIKFGSFGTFKNFIPDGYRFLRTRSKGTGIVRRRLAENYTGEDFLKMNGNLFCIPND